MPKTLIKSRLHSNKHKPKIKQEVNITKSFLLPNLQSFKKITIRNINKSINCEYSKIYHQQV